MNLIENKTMYQMIRSQVDMPIHYQIGNQLNYVSEADVWNQLDGFIGSVIYLAILSSVRDQIKDILNETN